MSKLWLVLVVAMLGGALWAGVIEVNFKPKPLPEIPAVANTLLKEKATFEKTRAYLLGLKRKGEMVVIRDKEKRLVVALLYVKNDAVRLEELIANAASQESILPQAKLLVKSLSLVRLNAQKAPVEVVASLKQESSKTFAQAQTALGGLQKQNEEYTQIHQEFSRLTKSLEQQIGELGLEKTPQPDVAGATDKNPGD